MIEIITGDLLESKEKYIAHQCNCLSKQSAGVAKAIFDMFPHADVYTDRDGPDAFNSIKIMGNGQDQRYVINMFSQYYPGQPKLPLSTKDGVLVREAAFHKCLLKVARIPKLESIAFPWRIGCGIAGGDWNHYLGTLTNFSNYVEETQGAKVIIYRRDGDE